MGKRKVLAAKKVNADAKTALKKEEKLIEEAKDNLKKAEEKKQTADKEAARETDPVKKDVIKRKAEEAANEVSARKTEVVDELKKKSTVLRDLAKDGREVAKAEALLAVANDISTASLNLRDVLKQPALDIVRKQNGERDGERARTMLKDMIMAKAHKVGMEKEA